MTLFIAKLFLLWLGASFIATAILCRLFHVAHRHDPPQQARDDQPDRLR